MPLPLNTVLAVGGAGSLGAFLLGKGGLFGRRSTSFEPGAPSGMTWAPGMDTGSGASSGIGGLNSAMGAGGGGFDPTNLVPMGLDQTLAGSMGSDSQSAGTFGNWVLDSNGMIGGLAPDSFQAIIDSGLGGPVGVTRTDQNTLPYVQIGSGSGGFGGSILNPTPGVVYGPNGSPVGFVDMGGNVSLSTPQSSSDFYNAVAQAQSPADQQAFYNAVAQQLGQPTPTAPPPAPRPAPAPTSTPTLGWGGLQSGGQGTLTGSSTGGARTTYGGEHWA